MPRGRPFYCWRATVSERSGHMRALKRMYPAYDYGYHAPEEIPNPNGTMAT